MYPNVDTLFASAARTATATSAVFAGYGNSNAFIAQLEVTAASGTTPTLDVVIQDSVDGTNWNTIYTFTQATTTTRAVKRYLTNIAADGPFTNQIRAVATIAGTDPSFTFSVKVYSQR
jgi:hypothetical protein